MSKAQRIRELLAQGLSTREVAEQVGCDPAYVRVAGRQRGAKGTSAIEVAYRVRRWGSMTAYYRERYAKKREWHRQYNLARRQKALEARGESA